MRHRIHPLRLLMAMFMLFGFLSFSGTYALAGEEAPEGTPGSAEGTAVADDPGDTDDSDDEEAVSALPETGTDPAGDNSGSILMIAALAAILLLAVAVVLRRMRLN